MKTTPSTKNTRHLKSASGGRNTGPHQRDASAADHARLSTDRPAQKVGPRLKSNAKASGYGDNVSGT